MQQPNANSKRTILDERLCCVTRLSTISCNVWPQTKWQLNSLMTHGKVNLKASMVSSMHTLKVHTYIHTLHMSTFAGTYGQPLAISSRLHCAALCSLYGSCIHTFFLHHTRMPTMTVVVTMATTRRTTITPAAITPPLTVLLFPFPFPLFPLSVPLFPSPPPSSGLPSTPVQLHSLTACTCRCVHVYDRAIRLCYTNKLSQHAVSTPTLN